MSEQQPNQPQENQPEQTPPNVVQMPEQRQETQQQTPSRSSSELEAENRALRAILSGHVEGINIDEELEFVGPTGKYRPAAKAAAPEPAPETRTSRREGLQNARAEDAPVKIDHAAIDKEFDDFLKTNYGFSFDESPSDA